MKNNVLLGTHLCRFRGFERIHCPPCGDLPNSRLPSGRGGGPGRGAAGFPPSRTWNNAGLKKPGQNFARSGVPGDGSQATGPDTGDVADAAVLQRALPAIIVALVAAFAAAWTAAEVVRRHAMLIYEEFGLSPYARIDCILDGQGTPWFLEANTLPGFTPLSLVPQAAAAAGIDFAELLELLMLVSIERWEARQRSAAR